MAALALALAALAAAAQAQILTPTPPPELWDTPAGEQLDQHAPEDPGEKYDVDVEAGFEAKDIVGNSTALEFVEGAVLGNVSASTIPFERNVSIPNPKLSEAWKLQQGARYGQTEVVADSATPFDADLHTVRFQSPKEGIAAGSACAERPELFDAGRESRAEFRVRVQLCRDIGETEVGPRAPVIYRYLETPDKGLHWREDYRGKVELDPDNPAKGGPGFVGAVDWIEPGRALAVGGTGIYPRRELRWHERDQFGRFNDCRESEGAEPPPVDDCTPANPLKADVAGAGRAWLFEDGKWEEIDLSEQRKTTTVSHTPRRLTACCAFAPQVDDPLDAPRTLPRAGIRGMTALALYVHTLDGEFGFAGANGQLWRWRSERDRPETGRFDKLYDAVSPEQNLFAPSSAKDTVHATGLRFRVRELRPRTDDPIKHSFLGVTAGCCMPETAGRSVEGFPKLLGFTESTLSGNPGAAANTWYVNSVHYDPTQDPGSSGAGIGESVAGDPQMHALTPAQAKRVNYRQDTPDSVYSFAFTPSGTGAGNALEAPNKVSLVYTPGAPAPGAGREPASIIASPFTVNARGAPSYIPLNPRTQAPRALTAHLSSARLVASDGDTDGFYNASGTSFASYPRPDWAVGVLRSRGQGLLVSTHEGQRPSSSSAIEGGCTEQLESEGGGGQGSRETGYLACQQQRVASGSPPEFDQERFEASTRSRYFVTDSHALNAIDMDDQSGAGWAVGDHGAILSFGAAAAAKLAAAGEPTPPKLRPRGSKPLAERSPYAALRAPVPSGNAGGVPALIERPAEHLRKAELRYAGAPDPERRSRPFGNEKGEAVTDVVVSRDGSEGWAIGPVRHRPYTSPTSPDDSQATLYHFDGGRWSSCDPFGVPGRVEPDAACESLKPLILYRPPGGSAIEPVRLIAAARVPYENDSDPSNDDEFEVVALGTDYSSEGDRGTERCTILRYRAGRWEHEGPRVRDAVADPCRSYHVGGTGISGVDLRDIAFSAPDDGWILSGRALYRFDGREWIACYTFLAQGGGEPTNHERCGNGGDRLPKGSSSQNPVANVAGLTQAGDRVYLYGRRQVSAAGGQTAFYPMVLYRERGSDWRADHDPGFGHGANQPPDPALQDLEGQIAALAVAQAKDGGYSGWAAGSFGLVRRGSDSSSNVWSSALMRLQGGAWSRWEKGDASRAFLGLGKSPHIAVVPDPAPGTPPALASHTIPGWKPDTLSFDPERQRWVEPSLRGDPNLEAIVPDERGGYWLALLGRSFTSSFARFSATHHKEVFSEVPNPVQRQERLTALTGTADGTLWAGTNIAGNLYRYERETGWERLAVPGWEPGKVPVPAAVGAIAVNQRGVGIAVGKQGRIADIAAGGVKLDPASGTSCDLAKIGSSELTTPCGTARTLRAAAVAADGSALAGGDSMALLWRPPGGDFRAIERPEAASSSTITGVSLPRPERAFLTTNRGQVFAGTLSGGHWSWQSESLNERNQLLAADVLNRAQALNAVAVRPDGTGYAVGARGLVLERSGDGSNPWRRVKTGFRDDLYSLALDAGGGPGVLIGAGSGQILTLRAGRFQIARAAAPYGVESSSGFSLGEEPEPGEEGGTPPIRALALVPGVAAGQTEAWALSAGFRSGPGTSKLYHYASAESEPLLDPVRAGPALADSPPGRPGELSLAALGRTRVGDELAITSRVVEELAARAKRPGGPRATLFTGDVSERAPSPGAATTNLSTSSQDPAGAEAFKAFRERIAEPLDASGAPLFGALGVRDLGQASDPSGQLKLGETYAWRAGMAERPWPSGRSETLFPRERAESELQFRAVADSLLAVRHQDLKVPGADTGLTSATSEKNVRGGASTHYALDVLREDGDGEQRKLARLIVLDNSHRALAASDPVQQPLEPKGGQSLWLEEMLCMRGERAPSPAARCTRSPDQQAIVLATTPTYSFGQGSQSDTAQDATLFESTLIRHRANLVVSGRFGVNTRYWATAAGVHEPCPGGAYRDAPPRAGERRCDRDTQGVPTDPSQAATETADALRSLGPPADRGAEAIAPLGAGLLPFVVASNAGGAFPDNSAQAKDGTWRGYTIVRLDPSGDPARTIVEQRPIYDWVRIDGQAFVLRPGQRMTLRGVGRALAPGGGAPAGSYVRFDRVEGQAVTHRYDLVEADPGRPWVPRRAADGAYVPIDLRVATIDPQSGLVKAGRGNQERTFAIGVLSLGCSGTDVGEGSACDPSLPGVHTATYPLVFEPRRSFRPKPPAALAALPLPKVLSAAAASIQSPQAPPPVNPQTPPVDIPPPPALPSLPTPTANPPAPPAPPAPPPPPVTPAATPLDLVTSPLGLNIAPQATVIPPPAPPIQPAPPGGARREARQRQAATQKSGADGAQGGASEEGAGGDLATGPPGAGQGQAMSRRAQARASTGSITTLNHTSQPSAWPRAALYTGGLTALAALLALGWVTARPGPRPRRRPPTAAAPAWNPTRRPR